MTNSKYRPMLAEKMDKAQISDWNDWVAEIKEDGHRVIICVSMLGVEAWSKPRKKKEMLVHPLPAHVVAALNHLPFGWYDGEDKAGDTATDVKRLDLVDKRTLVLFDVLFIEGKSTMGLPQSQRRECLELAYRIMLQSRIAGGVRPGTCPVQLVSQFNVRSQAEVLKLAQSVWKTGGEGLILKRKAATYQSDKRSRDWIKIKKLEHHVLTVVGWEASRGTVLQRGAYAIVKLRDDDGNETTCKTKDDFELERFEARAKKSGQHPDLGRRLVIECGGRTRDGGYKGPVIWDRWEDE